MEFPIFSTRKETNPDGSQRTYSFLSYRTPKFLAYKRIAHAPSILNKDFTGYLQILSEESRVYGLQEEDYIIAEVGTDDDYSIEIHDILNSSDSLFDYAFNDRRNFVYLIQKNKYEPGNHF